MRRRSVPAGAWSGRRVRRLQLRLLLPLAGAVPGSGSRAGLPGEVPQASGALRRACAARGHATRCCPARPGPLPAAAEALVAALVAQWQKPIDALGKAGRAFDVRCASLPGFLCCLVPPNGSTPTAGRHPCQEAGLEPLPSGRPSWRWYPPCLPASVLPSERSFFLFSRCATAQGLESLLGGARGGSFDLGGNIWDRKVRQSHIFEHVFFVMFLLFWFLFFDPGGNIWGGKARPARRQLAARRAVAVHRRASSAAPGLRTGRVWLLRRS